MLTAEERLEQLEKVFEELEDASSRVPIIVEGLRDVRALKLLGVEKNVVALHKGSSVFSLCEAIGRQSKEAIILTDWDRKGGQLARMLRDGLHANGVEANEYFRTQIVLLSKKEVKDMEGMPGFIERLRVKRFEGVKIGRAGKGAKDLD